VDNENNSKDIDDAYNLGIEHAMYIIGVLDLTGGEAYRHAFIEFNLNKLKIKTKQQG